MSQMSSNKKQKTYEDSMRFYRHRFQRWQDYRGDWYEQEYPATYGGYPNHRGIHGWYEMPARAAWNWFKVFKGMKRQHYIRKRVNRLYEHGY